MGVINCFRNGCENILCDRYSPNYGYICYECFDELVENGPETNIEDFMSSPKKPVVNKESSRARFNVEFPLREGW
jgi:hypothetical protein